MKFVPAFGLTLGGVTSPRGHTTPSRVQPPLLDGPCAPPTSPYGRDRERIQGSRCASGRRPTSAAILGRDTARLSVFAVPSMCATADRQRSATIDTRAGWAPRAGARSTVRRARRGRGYGRRGEWTAVGDPGGVRLGRGARSGARGGGVGVAAGAARGGGHRRAAGGVTPSVSSGCLRALPWCRRTAACCPHGHP